MRQEVSKAGGGMQLFGMLRATVSPLRSPPGVGGQLAKRVRCVLGRKGMVVEVGEADAVAAVCLS